MKKRKKKQKSVIVAPSLFERTSYTIGYNVILTLILIPTFFRLYTLDDVAYYLDLFTMLGLGALSFDFLLCLALFWFSFRQFFKDVNLIRFLWKSRYHILEVRERGAKVSYEGPEGTGKTLNVANDTLIIADEKDRKMRLEYYKKLPFRDKLLTEGDVDFKVLEDSFNYYEENEYYLPHVMANFSLVYRGRKNYPFDMAFLDQEKRLAEGFSLGLTEVGNILPNAWSRIPADESKDDNKLRIKSETLSLSRQYADLTITYDEQRTGEVFLGLRALNSENRALKEKINCLEPKFLMMIRDLIEDRKVARLGDKLVSLREQLYFKSNGLKRLDLNLRKKHDKVLKRLRKAVRMYDVINALCQRIGFYMFIYDSKESQDATKKIKENECFVVPRYFPFRFDTRGLRYNYRLFNRKPDF